MAGQHLPEDGRARKAIMDGIGQSRPRVGRLSRSLVSWVAQSASCYLLTRLIDVVSGTNSTALISVSKV